MTNKILLSMLAAGVVPAAAWADINVTDSVSAQTHWSNDGLGGIIYDGSDLANDSVAVAINGGSIKATCILPHGDFLFKVGVKENAEITITGSGVKQSTNENGDITFTVDKNDTQVTFTVGRTDSTKPYSFGKINLSAVFDLEAFKKECKIADITPIADDDNTSDEANRLRAEAEELETEKGTLSAIPATDDDVTLDFYAKREDVEQEYKDFAKKVDEHNEAVEAEDIRYGNQKYNEKLMTGHLVSIDELKTWLEEAQAAAGALIAEDGVAAADPYKKYVKEESGIMSQLGEVAKDIATLKKDVEADKAKDTEKVSDDTNQGYKDEIARIKEIIRNENTGKGTIYTDIEKVTADVVAHQTVQSNREALEKTYKEAWTYVTGTKVVDADYSSECTTKIDAIYNEADAKLSAVEIAGAAETANDDQKTYDEADAAIKAVYDECKTKVDNNEAAKADADEAIQTLKDQLEEQKGKIEDLTNGDIFNDDVEEIKEAIAKLEGTIAAEYGKLDLSDKDYDTSDAKNLINDLKVKVEVEAANQAIYNANKKLVNDLDEALVKARDEIVKAGGENGKVVAAKFNEGAYSNCKKAIDGLRKQYVTPFDDKKTVESLKETGSQYEAAKNAIDEYQTLGVEVVTAVKDAYSKLDELQGAADSLKVYVEGKINDKANQVVEGQTDCDLDAWKTTANGYAEKYKTLADELNTILKDKTADALYKAVIAKQEETNNFYKGEAAEVNGKRYEFAKKLTEANLAKLWVAYGVIASQLGADSAAVTYGPGLELAETGLKATLAGYNAKIDDKNQEVKNIENPENEQGEKVNKYDKQDSAIVELYKDMISTMDKAMFAAKNNVANKNALDEKINSVKDAINKAVEYVDETSIDPAKTHFTDLLNDLENNDLTSQLEALNTLKDSIEADYNGNKLDKDALTYMEKAGNIGTEVRNIISDCDKNEANHNKQIAESNKATTQVQNALNQLKKYDSTIDIFYTVDGEEKTGKLADVEAVLKECNSGITKANQEVAEAYGNGTCSDVVTAYTDIEAKIAEIMASVEQAYGDAVAIANERTATETMGANINVLELAFKTGVDTYDAYISSPAEGDYHNQLFDLLKDHVDIYSYAAKIVELKDEIATLVSEANAEDKVLKTEDFDGVKDTYEKYLEKINGYTESVKTKANNFAEEYYNKKKAEVQDKIDAAKDVMAKAGISDENQKESIGDAKEAIAHADADVEEAKKTGLSLSMGEILSLLEGVNHDIDMEPAAFAQWNEYKSEANDAVGALSAEMAKLDANVIAAELDEFDDLNNEIEALDDQANEAYDESKLLNILPSLKKELDAVLEKLKDVVEEAKETKEKYDANKEALEELNKKLDTLKENHKNMLDAIGSLDLTLEQFEKINTPAIDKKVDTASQKITEATDASADDYQGYIDDAQTAIDEALAKALATQKAKVDQMMHDAQYAFNEAKAAATDEDKAAIEAWRQVLAKIEEAYSEAKTLDDLKDIESRLEALAEKHEYGTNDDDVSNDEALANLAKQKEAVEDAIAEVQAVIDAIEYADKDNYSVADYEQQLADLEAKWTAEGANVVLSQHSYIAKMEEMVEALGAYKQEIEAAEAAAKEAYDAEQKRIEISNTKAAELEGELAELKNKLDEVLAVIGNYETFNQEENEQLKLINANIATQEADLAAAKEAYSLTENSTLQYAAIINNAIDAMALTATYDETWSKYNAATEAYNKAVEAVTTGNHANQSELEANLAEVKELINALAPTGDYNKAAEVIENANNIISMANAIVESAEEQSYVSGDADGNGKVTTSDFVTIIDYILGNVEMPRKAHQRSQQLMLTVTARLVSVTLLR